MSILENVTSIKAQIAAAAIAAGRDPKQIQLCAATKMNDADAVRQAIAAGTDGVKFHLLHVLRGTDLAGDHAAEKFRCLELEEYALWLKTCLEQVPPSVVVHRITGDGAKRDLVAPLWSADKKRVLNYLKHELE